MPTDPYHRRVKNLMSRTVVSIGSEESMHDAIRLMEDNRVSALPVLDQRNRCVGILTATDLIDLAHEIDEGLMDLEKVSNVTRQWLVEKLTEHDFEHQTVAAHMTTRVASVDPESTLAHAATEILRHRVHHLPVLDDGQHLLGIISTTDILAAFVEGAPDA